MILIKMINKFENYFPKYKKIMYVYVKRGELLMRTINIVINETNKQYTNLIYVFRDDVQRFFIKRISDCLEIKEFERTNIVNYKILNYDFVNNKLNINNQFYTCNQFLFKSFVKDKDNINLCTTCVTFTSIGYNFEITLGSKI